MYTHKRLQARELCTGDSSDRNISAWREGRAVKSASARTLPLCIPSMLRRPWGKHEYRLAPENKHRCLWRSYWSPSLNTESSETTRLFSKHTDNKLLEVTFSVQNNSFMNKINTSIQISVTPPNHSHIHTSWCQHILSSIMAEGETW